MFAVKKVCLLLLMLSLLLSGQAMADSSLPPVRIGVFEPLTGEYAEGGTMEYEGIRVAHAQYPTVNGRKIELVVADSGSSEAGAVNAARYLVEEAEVDIVLGTWGSSLAIAGSAVFEEAQVPAIGTSCTNPMVTMNNDYYFRVCYIDEFQGTVLAQYAKDHLQAETAAILCDISNIYAIGLRSFFIDAFGPKNILAEGNFITGETAFSAHLDNLFALAPDVLFVPSSYTEAGHILRQAYASGYTDIAILGGDTWETEELIAIAGDAAEACRFTTFYDIHATATLQSETFLQGYADMFGGNPKGAVTALGYDAYLAAIHAITAAESLEGPALRDALSALSFHGVTGDIRFDDNGDAIVRRAVIMTVRDGAFAYLDTVEIND